MATRISTGAANAQADSFGILFNAGVLEIRSGTAPAAAATAPAGTLLASITLPADAFGAPAAGVIAKAGTWQDAAADAAGTATWARFKQSGDLGTTNSTDIRCDVDIGATGSGATLELDNTSITVGQEVTVTAFTFTQPLT